MDLIWIFLPAILLLGIITSYQDIRYGKIKNKYIIAALIYAIAAHIILILFFSFVGTPIRYSYITDLFINVVIAMGFGYIAWWTKLWSAADGKLLIAYAALIPLTVYSNNYVKYFPSITLLVNTFVPFFLFTFLRVSFFTRIRQKKETLKNIKPIELFTLLLNIFWITWIPGLIGTIFRINLDFLVNLIIILLLIIILQRVFRENMWKVSLILCGLRVIFDYNYITSVLFLEQFILFFAFIMVIFFILKFGSQFFTNSVGINRLKQGMILTERIYRESIKGKYKKGKFPSGKKVEILILEHPAEGLTNKDIKELQKLFRDKRLSFSNIKIQQTLPFAPIMFLGILLTLISKGSFLTLFKNLAVLS